MLLASLRYLSRVGGTRKESYHTQLWFSAYDMAGDRFQEWEREDDALEGTQGIVILTAKNL